MVVTSTHRQKIKSAGIVASQFEIEDFKPFDEICHGLWEPAPSPSRHQLLQIGILLVFRWFILLQCDDIGEEAEPEQALLQI